MVPAPKQPNIPRGSGTEKECKPAKHSGSGKGGNGTPNTTKPATQDSKSRTPKMSTPIKDQNQIKKGTIVSFNEEDIRDIFVVLLLRDFRRVVSQK